jgi:hypothetical protein
VSELSSRDAEWKLLEVVDAEIRRRMTIQST